MNRIGQIAFASLVVTAPAFANTYLNLTPQDNTAFGNAAGSRVNLTVTAAKNAGWVNYSEFLGEGEKAIWTSASNETVYVFNPVKNVAEKFVNFADRVGSKYVFSVGDCMTGGTLAQKQISLTTPAGTFSNVVRMTFANKCYDGGTMEAWFAPGVGVIKWTEQTKGGPQSYELTDGKVAGKVFGKVPVQTALKVTPAFPKTQFALGTQEAAAANLTLTNSANQNMVLHFASGQEFEISLIDANRKVLNTWSARVRFMQGIHDVTLAAGKSRSFGGTLALQNLNGQALVAGQYTLRIEMKHANVAVAGVTQTMPIISESIIDLR